MDYMLRPDIRSFSHGLYRVFLTVFLAVTLFLCLFLVVSSAVGLAVLRKAGVSSENQLGLIKLLCVAVVLFVATLFRAVNRLMQWYGSWYFPDWYWNGLDNVACYVLMMTAILYLVLSALHSKHRSMTAPRESEREMSQKLLPYDPESVLEEGQAVPKAYLV